jgi:hypothetical protein
MQKLTSFIDQGCRVLLGDIFAEYLQNTEVAIFQLILTAPLLQATIIMADHPQEVLPMIGDQVMVDENLGTPPDLHHLGTPEYIQKRRIFRKLFMNMLKVDIPACFYPLSFRQHL